MKWVSLAASDKLYKEIRIVAQMETNKNPCGWYTGAGKPNASKAVRMLIWMGLAAYKASPKYNQSKWDVAAYMVDHDGLRPEQVRRDEIDSILTAFEAIEKEDK